MATSWRSLVNELREQTGALSRRWEHWARAKRTLMAVTRDARCKTSLRAFSLQQGWRILFADTLKDGIRLQTMERICVLIYDRQLPGIEWRHGLRTLLASGEPMLPIVIAEDLNASLRSEVMNCGGYDLARNPLEPDRFVPLVNGAFALTESIDAVEGFPSQYS
jgi:DNA-binding response OmpR family regulator